MEFWWMYALIGLSAGVLGSMLGVGGGILMVPLMVQVCGIGQKPAQAMSLAVMIPMALTSTIRYYLNPEIRPDMLLVPILVMAALAIVGAFVGTEAVNHLSGTTLKKIFAVIMVIVAVKMFFEQDQRRTTTGADQPAAEAAAADRGTDRR